MKGKPTTIQNQTSNPTTQNSVLNRDPTLTPFQRIVNSIHFTKKEAATKSKKASDFVGIILYSRVWPMAKFANKHPPDSSFYRSVLTKSGKKVKPKKDSSIIKAYCYIPEISGMLPFPDYEIYDKYINLYNGTNEPIQGENESFEEFEKKLDKYFDKVEKQMTDLYPDLYKEFQKIVMHPVFYKYVESESQPSPFQYVKVKYTGDFDTYSEGIIEEVYSDFYEA